MSKIVISDLHIADGGPSDEFKQNGKEGQLRDFLNSIPDESLYVNGDLMDLLRATLSGIMNYWGPLVTLIMQKSKVWVAGNHDDEALSFLEGQFMGVPIVDMLIEGDTLFLHGHRFDSLTHSSKSVGATVTQMEDWLVRHTDPEVGVWARDLEILMRGGRDGEKETYAERAFEFIKSLRVGASPVTRVVLGHTHQIDHRILKIDGRPDLEMFNTGCWIDGCQNVTMIEDPEFLGSAAAGEGRSSQWPALRKRFLQGKICAACGETDKLEAHHIEPFHVNPSKELDEKNLIPLCEGNKNINCHLVIGHDFNFRGWNPDVRGDAGTMIREKQENGSRIKKGE